MSVHSVDRLFEYNKWAWQRVFPSLEALPQEEYFAERPFFWGSLHGLASHGYGAEKRWLQRIGGESPSRLAGDNDFETFADLREGWFQLWAEWQEFVDSLTIGMLDETLQSRNFEGPQSVLKLDDVLRHVFNHATEHRSQMTPSLAQLGHPTEPLDYAYFAIAEKR